jgi:hypothetical protein
MSNGRCRMHGGPSTGPRTPEGEQRASQRKHGRYSKATIQRRREVRRSCAIEGDTTQYPTPRPRPALTSMGVSQDYGASQPAPGFNASARRFRDNEEPK